MSSLSWLVEKKHGLKAELPQLTIATREVLDPGVTVCRINELLSERLLGVVGIERRGETADRKLMVQAIETAPRIPRVPVYLATWREMLLLAHHEGRALVSNPNPSSEEAAAWQWLSAAGAAEITQEFAPIEVLGRQTVYCTGAALALPPQFTEFTSTD